MASFWAIMEPDFDYITFFPPNENAIIMEEHPVFCLGN